MTLSNTKNWLLIGLRGMKLAFVVSMAPPDSSDRHAIRGLQASSASWRNHPKRQSTGKHSIRPHLFCAPLAIATCSYQDHLRMRTRNRVVTFAAAVPEVLPPPNRAFSLYARVYLSGNVSFY